jgi:transcriptional regulator with XRE-family HTH domain
VDADADLSARLALVVRRAREGRGLSTSALAERSGVSRAMITRIEQGAVSPTAALLSRLSGALQLTLSELIARAELPEPRLARADEQPVWTDPPSGYRRRAVSPPAATAADLVEVELPPGAAVAFGADAYRFIDQQIWVLEGALRFTEGDRVFELERGDCLALGAPQDCEFRNPTDRPCRYLVVVARRPG